MGQSKKGICVSLESKQTNKINEHYLLDYFMRKNMSGVLYINLHATSAVKIS